MKTTKTLFSKLEKARQEKTLEIFINHPNLNISLMQTDSCNNYFGNLPVSLRTCETYRSDISFAKPITPGELCFKLILEILIVYDRSLSTSDNFIRIATNMPTHVVSVKVLSERNQSDQSLAALARFTTTNISNNVRQKAKGKTFQDLIFFNPAQMSALLAIYTTQNDIAFDYRKYDQHNKLFQKIQRDYSGKKLVTRSAFNDSYQIYKTDNTKELDSKTDSGVCQSLLSPPVSMQRQSNPPPGLTQTLFSGKDRLSDIFGAQRQSLEERPK